MCGAFAALGVGIVDVVVEGLLVPGFGHFQQMIAAEQLAYDARCAAHGLMKFVGQRELQMGMRAGAHKILHELDEHARGIFLQGGMHGIEHFVVQTAQGVQPFLCSAVF